MKIGFLSHLHQNPHYTYTLTRSYLPTHWIALILLEPLGYKLLQHLQACTQCCALHLAANRDLLLTIRPHSHRVARG